MKAIWKFRFPAIPGRHRVGSVLDAEIISVQAGEREICVWAIIDTVSKGVTLDGEEPAWTFYVVRSGEQIVDPKQGEEYKFLGTCAMYPRSLFLHVFEVREKK